MKVPAKFVGEYIYFDMSEVGSIKDSEIHILPPQQVCYVCKELFWAYLVDDEVWKKLPEKYWDKLVCHDCFKKLIGRR